MNKRVRIGLIVVITAILALAMAVPGLARPPGSGCWVSVTAYDKNGNILVISVDGDLTAWWDAGILYNTCTGTIPFGDPYPHKNQPVVALTTFEKYCEISGISCTGNVFYMDTEVFGTAGYIIYDPYKDTYHSLTYGFVEIVYDPATGDGAFYLYKKYAPK